MQSFAYVKPHSLEEVGDLLIQHGDRASLLAGGADLLIEIAQGRCQPALVIDLKGLPALTEISYGAEGLRLGALATLAQVAAHPQVRRHYPALAEICQEMATPAIRNRSTVGGNVCQASPAADTAPVLLCYGAVCQVQGRAGIRQLPLDEFFIGPRATALQPGEVLTGLRLPLATETAVTYQRLTQGQGGHITLAGVAAGVQMRNGQGWEWRLALAAAAPTPRRAPAAEAVLHGPRPSAAAIDQAAALAADACTPIDDVRASANYRLAMIEVLARRALQTLLTRLPGGAR